MNKELKTRIDELMEDKGKKKISRQWCYSAIRHAVRNCDFDEGDDGDSFSKYDGEIVADILNLVYQEFYPPNPQDHPGRSPRVHPVVGRTDSPEQDHV